MKIDSAPFVKTREEYAKEIGLPTTASWVDICNAKTELYRRTLAREYGLSRNASFRKIIDEQEKRLSRA